MSISSSAVPFEWHDHLGLAEELAQRDDETALRTVVYLSYYAIYNTVVAHLLLHGAHVDGGNHIAAWDLLNHGKRSRPQLVKRGHYLRKLRNKVSYDLALPPHIDLKAVAQKAIQDARTMLVDLRRGGAS